MLNIRFTTQWRLAEKVMPTRMDLCKPVAQLSTACRGSQVVPGAWVIFSRHTLCSFTDGLQCYKSRGNTQSLFVPSQKKISPNSALNYAHLSQGPKRWLSVCLAVALTPDSQHHMLLQLSWWKCILDLPMLSDNWNITVPSSSSQLEPP